MKIFSYILSILMLMSFGTIVQAANAQQYVLTSSNDDRSNELLVYLPNGKLVQAISTRGQGGVSGNGGGVITRDNIIAVVNHKSSSVALFENRGGEIQLVQVIPTSSEPVSLAFGAQHLYVLGDTTVESHLIDGNGVREMPDGVVDLLIADGSAAQVGFLEDQLILTEKKGMIAVVNLKNGAVTEQITPVQLPPPPGNDTPYGLVTRGRNGYVTIAHSDAIGLVRNGTLITVTPSGDQHAPCWLALMGSWMFSTNSPSRTISRYRVGDNEITLEKQVVAKTEGVPADIDINERNVAVVESNQGNSRLTLFSIDPNGNLVPFNSFQTANNANGVAILSFK